MIFQFYSKLFFPTALSSTISLHRPYLFRNIRQTSNAIVPLRTNTIRHYLRKLNDRITSRYKGKNKASTTSNRHKHSNCFLTKQATSPKKIVIIQIHHLARSNHYFLSPIVFLSNKYLRYIQIILLPQYTVTTFTIIISLISPIIPPNNPINVKIDKNQNKISKS